MKKPLFTGVCTALVTPFLGNVVNYPLLELLLGRQIAAGIEAVVLCGTTGESPTLSDCEKLEIFRRCARYAGGRCKIIAGTGSNDTQHAVALSAAAEAAGADAAEAAGTAERLCSTNEAPPTVMQATAVTVSRRRTAGRRWRR